jgi:hypothetical protein
MLRFYKVHIYRLLDVLMLNPLRYFLNDLVEFSRSIFYFLFIRHYSKSVLHDSKVLLVVARFNEDITWLDKVNIPYIIYNKGKNDIPKHHPTIKLPNIGRESHSYLHYIYSNFSNLPKRIIFTQADPFEHQPTFLDDIVNHKMFLDVQPLSIRFAKPLGSNIKHRPEYKEGIPSNAIINTFKQSYNGIEFFVQKVNFNFFTTWPSHSQNCDFQTAFKYKYGPNYFEGLNRLLGTSFTESIWFNYSAIFAVDSNNVHRHQKLFYLKCLRLLLEHKDNGNIFERLWLGIFGYEELPEGVEV